jgi:hypothetical protein
MIVTKHVSLDDDCIKKMQPYEDRHNGNFSAAIKVMKTIKSRPAFWKAIINRVISSICIFAIMVEKHSKGR